MANIQKKQNNAVAPRSLSPSYVANGLIEVLNRPFVPKPDDDRVIPPETTVMDMIMETTAYQAAYGDHHARKEIFDRIDGKPAQQISIAQLMILLSQIPMEELSKLQGKTIKDADITIDAEKD